MRMPKVLRHSSNAICPDSAIANEPAGVLNYDSAVVLSLLGVARVMEAGPHDNTRAAALLGPLEYACLQVLWERGAASVPEVLEAVNARQPHSLAYTTVMTVLARLHDKELVRRQRRGRGYRYEPRYSETELVDRLGRREVEQLVERYGQVALAHFAQTLRRTNPELLHDLLHLADEDQHG